ncbi:hypothetical protein E8E13_003296 [Curvularia kusanoi]|uniref:Heterokaryon incompatibility domain-containing protein n=1 Tax=Curvularia kusanoi TaxID=90978 RepID=A0A9P4TAB5_CURKU|nr:hypothetical protein E8E13_003296 [Curvularia kusanoi]
MYDVYANAREVAVNLSTQDSPYIDEACAWMTRMAPSFPEKLMDPLVWGRYVRDDTSNSDDEIDMLARGVINDIKSNIRNEKRDPDFLRGFYAVLSAFAAEWWTRAWVVQEFRASQAAVFIIGQCSVKSAVLMAIMIALAQTSLHDLRLPDSSFVGDALKHWSFDDIDYITALGNSIMLLCGTAYGNGGLGEFLYLCRFRKATDARDKVYAYLGLIDSKYEIKPNYESKGPEGVRRMLIEITRQMIIHDENLDILRWVFPKRSTRHRPSWVPDWTELDVYATAFPGYMHKFSSADPQVAFSSHDEVLSVRGAYIGTLDRMEPPSGTQKAFGHDSWKFHVSQDCYVHVASISIRSCKLGDQAWILFGSEGVFLLREENDAFRLIGLASVKDDMGKVWRMEETCGQRRINII